jgi:hypothetical protein
MPVDLRLHVEPSCHTFLHPLRSINRYVEKPGKYERERDYRKDVARYAASCIRPYYSKWLDAFRRGMGEEGLKKLNYTQPGDERIVMPGYDPAYDGKAVKAFREEAGCNTNFEDGHVHICRYGLEAKQEKAREDAMKAAVGGVS